MHDNLQYCSGKLLIKEKKLFKCVINIFLNKCKYLLKIKYYQRTIFLISKIEKKYQRSGKLSFILLILVRKNGRFRLLPSREKRQMNIEKVEHLKESLENIKKGKISIEDCLNIKFFVLES